MNKAIISTGLCWLWIALLVLILDFGSKQWIMIRFWFGESVPVIPCINFIYTHNSGAAFGFLADRGGWQRWAFITIALVITAFLVFMMYYSNKHARMSNAACALIVGGALGNLFDRIVHGVVIDFIDFYIGNWHWPTFNVADASICIGTILFIFKSFFSPTGKIDK